MDRTPSPVSLAAALALPRTPGRSAEVFVDGDLEVRFAARPTDGPQVPHEKDELYFVAAGTARYQVEDEVTDWSAQEMCVSVRRAWRTDSRTIRTTSAFGCCSTGRRSSGPPVRRRSAAKRPRRSSAHIQKTASLRSR